MRKTLIAALIIAPLGFAAPAQAEDRVLTIFGSDKCPENTICVRAPETERFRIPKNLRDQAVIAPNRQSWAARASSVIEAGDASVAAPCSPQGPFGGYGCAAKQIRRGTAQRDQATTEAAPVIDK